MPYRAMFSTIVTAGVALLCLAMWLWYVAPLVAAAGAVAATMPAATGHATGGESPELMLKRLVEGVMLLSFLLICLLLVVGFAATFREWVRYGSRPSSRRLGAAKTQYVDAWKIAGERLMVEKTDTDGDEE